MQIRSPGGVTGGPQTMGFRGLVRVNRRGLCPVCGLRHAVCTSPEQPELLYPPVDTRTIPLRPELRFNGPPEPVREAAMPLVRSMDLTGRQQMNRGDYVADRRLYLNARGQVVEAKDPEAVSLLAAEGTTIPAQRAMELGLMSEAQGRQAEPGAPKTTYVVPGPGPDDPGTFYDDGTSATPAGNEGVSDGSNPRSADREKHLAADVQYRVPEALAPSMDESGARRVDANPSGRSVRQGGTVGEPSGSGEEEQKRRAAEQEANAVDPEEENRKVGGKAAAPAEDKAQAAPETKNSSRGRSAR